MTSAFIRLAITAVVATACRDHAPEPVNDHAVVAMVARVVGTRVPAAEQEVALLSAAAGPQPGFQWCSRERETAVSPPPPVPLSSMPESVSRSVYEASADGGIRRAGGGSASGTVLARVVGRSGGRILVAIDVGGAHGMTVEAALKAGRLEVIQMCHEWEA